MKYIKQSGVERPNKSQLKREIAALKVHAEFLCKLKQKDQLTLTLNDEIRQGLAEYQLIKHPNAQKRHIQFVNRLLSEFNDLEALLEQLHLLQNPHLIQQQVERQLEIWVKKLLDGHQESIDAIFTDYPDVDKQQFMQVLRNAQKENQVTEKQAKLEGVENSEQKAEGKQVKKLKSILRKLMTQR